MAKKKPSNGTPIPEFLKDAIGARLVDDQGREKYPRLSDAILPVYEGSKLIVAPGKLTIKVEGAHYRVVLDLPTYVLQTSVITDSLGSCLDAMESYLAGRPIFLPGYSKSKKKLPVIDEGIQ